MLVYVDGWREHVDNVGTRIDVKVMDDRAFRTRVDMMPKHDRAFRTVVDMMPEDERAFRTRVDMMPKHERAFRTRVDMMPKHERAFRTRVDMMDRTRRRDGSNPSTWWIGRSRLVVADTRMALLGDFNDCVSCEMCDEETAEVEEPMKKIDIENAPKRFGTGYPAPYDVPCTERRRFRLGKAAGITQFGVNLLRLPPGQWSSQRHWHHHNDEFVMVMEGEVVLVTDGGEEVLRAGDCAGFCAGDRDGHHFQNRSTTEAVLLEVGSSHPQDVAEYPDIDLHALPEGYVHKDGTPYGAKRMS